VERARLRIVLDGNRRSFAVGETVSGRIEVEVDEACECDPLTARLGWVTAGDSNEASEDPVEEVVASGEWKGGDRHSFPFGLNVPKGPPGYEGRHFSVRWRVRAAASLSWAIDPETEEPIEVRGGPVPDGTLVAVEEAGCLEMGCATVLVLFGAAALVAFFAGARLPVPGWLALATGVIALAISGWAVPQALTRHRLGKTSVEAGPSPCPRGSEMAVRLTMTPRRDLALSEVRANLVATETSVKGSGKTRSTRTVEVGRITGMLEGPRKVAAGREAVYAGVLEVPDAAPPTLEAGPHSVTWKLSVAMDIPRAADAGWDFVVVIA